LLQKVGGKTVFFYFISSQLNLPVVGWDVPILIGSLTQKVRSTSGSQLKLFREPNEDLWSNPRAALWRKWRYL